MAPRQGIRKKRRDQLTRAAMRCIVKKGYDHVTLEDVCREVGMSRGIASYYFKTKEDLLVSVLQLMIEDTNEVIRTYIRFPRDFHNDDELTNAFREYIKEKDPLELIFEGNRALIYYFMENPAVVFVALEFASQAPRNQIIAELNSYINNRFWDIGEIVISEGIRRGVFIEQDARSSAQMLISSGIGILMAYSLNNDFFPLEQKINEINSMVARYLTKPRNYA